MAEFQTSAYEALGQHTSTNEVELTSFTLLSPRMTNDDHANTSDQYELGTPSTEALHQSLDTEGVEVARQSPLQSDDNIQEYCSIPRDEKRRSAIQRVSTYT